jgi:hypothetical protein
MNLQPSTGDHRHVGAPLHVSFGRIARYVNVALGALLLAGGLAGLPGPMLAPIAATVGIAVLGSALLALKSPSARFGSLVAALALFVAALTVRGDPHGGAGVALGTSLIVVAMALVPSRASD